MFIFNKALRKNFARSDKGVCKWSWKYNLELFNPGVGNRQLALRLGSGNNNHSYAPRPTQLSLYWLVKALSLNQDKSLGHNNAGFRAY